MRLKEAIRYFSNAEGFSWGNHLEIFHELPFQLKYRVAMLMHKQAVGKLSFFNNKHELIISIAPLLSPVLLKRYEYLYKKGDTADEVYFITKGEISILSDKNMIFCKYSKGGCLGDIEFVNETNRKYTALAIRSASLLILQSKAKYLIKEEFPEIWKSFVLETKKKEIICNIALEKANEILKMKDNLEFADMGHENIRKFLNDKILDEFNKNFLEKTENDIHDVHEFVLNELDKLYTYAKDLEERTNIITQKIQLIEKLLGQ